MTEKTVTTTTCNRCRTEINTASAHINAGPYGAHFHYACFDKMSAIELAVDLGLDDIKSIIGDDWQAAEKIIYSIRGKQASVRPGVTDS